MTPENLDRLKQLLKQFLNNNNLHLYKEIWADTYTFKINKIDKDKDRNSDYVIERFVEDCRLATDKISKNYKFWQFVYKNDKTLAFDMVKQYINIPKSEYDRKEYIENIFNLYANNKKENNVIWSIVNTKKFLNNNINIVLDLFNEDILLENQKQHIINYYVELLNKNAKFNNLENKRIISVLNEHLTSPLSINLLESTDNDKLMIQTKTSSCVYFEIKVQELMAYNLKFSKHFAEHLLDNFNVLLPKVAEAETQDVIKRIQYKNSEALAYHYVVLTSLNENIIKDTFTNFVDSYLEILDNDKFIDKEDMLDCLKFSVIKSRKENLEKKLVSKNMTTKVNKI